MTLTDRWWEHRPTVTVVDVLELNPCYTGAADFILSHSGVIAAPAARFSQDHIRRASRADGDGYGDGSGSGDGYGDGSGDGYGDGYGSGDGSGDGSGYGYGDRYGYGDGSYGAREAAAD